MFKVYVLFSCPSCRFPQVKPLVMLQGFAWRRSKDVGGAVLFPPGSFS